MSATLHPMAAEMMENLVRAAHLEESISVAKGISEALEAENRIETGRMTGPDGKALYSNDKSRDAATILACGNDPNYTQAQSELQDLKRRREIELAGAEALKWTMRLMCAKGVEE